MSLFGAIQLIFNGKLKNDLDANSHKILNLDTSNLSGLGSFGVQAAHAVFMGPTSGTAVPTFRIPTPSEFGAQPYSANLDLYAAFTPTVAALNLLGGITTPAVNSYIRILPSGFPDLRNSVQLRSDLNAQTAHTNLDIIAGLGFGVAGPKLLTLGNPAALNSFILVDPSGNPAYLTGAQLITELALVSAPFIDSTAIIKGSADATKKLRIEVDGFTTGTTRVMTPPNYDFTPASISASESLINKRINGLNVAVGSTPTPLGSATFNQAPSGPYYLNILSIGPEGLDLTFDVTNPTRLVLPATGTLATVAGTIPFSYLDTKTDLGGKLATDGKVSSQLAVRTAIDAHSGHITPAPSVTKASATSVDLTAETTYEIDITGSVNIEEFLMNEGDEHLVYFSGSPNLIPGANFKVPGGITLRTKPGVYAVIRQGIGADALVTTMLVYSGYGSDPMGKAANFVGGTITELTTFGIRYLGGSYDLRINNADSGATANRTLQVTLNDASRVLSLSGDVTLGGSFITGANSLNFQTSGSTTLTLPTTGTLATLDGTESFTNKTVNGIKFYSGSGSPEGVVTAAIGSIYTSTAGGASTTLYVKTSGAGNTGWSAK